MKQKNSFISFCCAFAEPKGMVYSPSLFKKKKKKKKAKKQKKIQYLL